MWLLHDGIKNLLFFYFGLEKKDPTWVPLANIGQAKTSLPCVRRRFPFFGVCDKWDRPRYVRPTHREGEFRFSTAAAEQTFTSVARGGAAHEQKRLPSSRVAVEPPAKRRANRASGREGRRTVLCSRRTAKLESKLPGTVGAGLMTCCEKFPSLRHDNVFMVVVKHVKKSSTAQ